MEISVRCAQKGLCFFVIHLRAILTMFILISFFFSLPTLYGQQPQNGLKYIKNYETGIHPRNWAITQDKRGVIYVANMGCVFEFDGVSSRIVNIPGGKVLSVATDSNGTVYVGGDGEFGYLKLEKPGSLRYVSLKNRLNEKTIKFSDIRQINVVKEEIYFRAQECLFRWNPKTADLTPFKPEKRFNASFECNGKLFLHQREVGLTEIKNDALAMLPGGEKFADKKVYMMASFTPYSNKILIGTRGNGFFTYEDGTIQKFSTDVDEYIRQNFLYHGIRLKSSAVNSHFALATRQGGLVIIDDNGKLLRIFSNKNGLKNDVVSFVYQDTIGNLWLTLEKNIAKIEYNSPFFFYNENFSNLPGSVFAMAGSIDGGRLLAGTSRGLYIMTDSGTSSHFSAVPGIPGICFDILEVDNSILVATTQGVYLLGNELRFKEKLIDTSSYVFKRSEFDKNLVFLGSLRGLYALRHTGTGWIVETNYKDTSGGGIRTIAADQKGNLWLGTTNNFLLKVDFSVKEGIRNPKVTWYDEFHGLPYREVRVFWAAGHAIFASGKKIYRFDENENKFVPDDFLGGEFIDGSRSIFTLSEDGNGNIWFHSEFRNMLATPRPEGGYHIEKQKFLRIPPDQTNVIYPDPSGNVIWIGENEGLTGYDINKKENVTLVHRPIIRELLLNEIPNLYEEDTGIYKNISQWQAELPVLSPQDKDISFIFAAPNFRDQESNKFSCLLDGYDKKWSAWTTESKRVYTNLDPGFYTFQIRAKNVYEVESEEERFQFEIPPPWYQTWWAYLIFGIASLYILSLTVKWRSWKLEQEKKKLEQIVKSRTREIDEKNLRLESQTSLLKEQSDQLKELDRIKSRFFANLSHEFRTPLTLIIGPLEQMLTKKRNGDEEKELHVMLRNSRRLLLLINQLLDLSKIDSGKMKLQASAQDFVTFAKGITATFELMARQKGLKLSFQSDAEAIELYFDTAKMEAVFSNLLVNALKFTPPGGDITVTVTKTVSKDHEQVRIIVRDTGIGIPGDQLKHIFDRFYRVEEHQKNGVEAGTSYRDIQGTGIGLALTRELILLHHGTIDVSSRMDEDHGTEFTILLPTGSQHLEPGESASSSHDALDAEGTGGTLGLYAGEVENKGNESIDEPGLKESIDESEENANSSAEALPIILVVEDNTDARHFIRGALEPYYRIEEAINGDDGLQKAKSIIPDLVVSDVMMPVKDGYQLCGALKKDIATCHIPVILLTAKAAEENVVEGLETGADDYITKPFSTRILLARIKNLIDLRHQLQKSFQREMILQPSEVKVSSMDETFIKEVQEVIEKNLSDQFFNVEKLGEKLYMSRATLYRKISALTGLSPREFIKSYRLKRGAQLLRANFGNITEVAFEVGFSSTTYFGKCFKEKFHQLPSAFVDSSN